MGRVGRGGIPPWVGGVGVEGMIGVARGRAGGVRGRGRAEWGGRGGLVG